MPAALAAILFALAPILFVPILSKRRASNHSRIVRTIARKVITSAELQHAESPRAPQVCEPDTPQPISIRPSPEAPVSPKKPIPLRRIAGVVTPQPTRMVPSSLDLATRIYLLRLRNIAALERSNLR
jgi:hypothetical protein